MSVNVQPMTGTKVSYNSKFLAFVGNPISGFQAGGNGNMFPALIG